MRKRVFIIAEAGVNHNGDINLAYQLCEAAKMAGADAIKFQIFDTGELVTKKAKKAEYQKKNDGCSNTQYDMLKKLELSKEEFKKVASYCSKIGIKFLATAFDDSSLEFLYSLGVDTIKIPSGEITNLPYLIKVSKMWNKIILSTGMATIDEIKNAHSVLSQNGAQIVVLHCTTEYPAPLQTVNLNAMRYLGEALGLEYGYSDHTEGIEVSLAAVALGAIVIEKHFTLDRLLEGPDHLASIEPDDLKRLVDSVRHIETALGENDKIVSEAEMKNRLVVRKSIVAKKDIKKGDLLTDDNITTKRPGTGITPMKWFEVLGTRAKKDFKKDELIAI